MDVEEITIDPSANWKAVEKPKDSGDDDGTYYIYIYIFIYLSVCVLSTTNTT